MFILGLNLSFNSSASLWKDTECLMSISEERLIGEKNTKKFPIHAIKACLDSFYKDTDEELIIAYSHYEPLSKKYLEKYWNCSFGIEHLSSFNADGTAKDEILKEIVEKELNIKVSNVYRVNHHMTHKFSAYAVYGYDPEQTVLTMDGFGDGISARLTIRGQVVAELPLSKSLALIYQFATGALGFKEHQHEGKLTGLATGFTMAACHLESVYKVYDFLNDIYENDKLLLPLDEDEQKQVKESFIKDFDKFLALRKTIYNFIKTLLDNRNSSLYFTQSYIAKAVQMFVEDKLLSFLRENLRDKEITDSIYLAGGLFGNVALNYLFGQFYKHVYISPAMGDEGTAMGAAAYIANKYNRLPNAFHPEYIINAGINISEPSNTLEEGNIYSIIAQLMKNKNPYVFLCRGRSEFGPRALMHRSTIFRADDEILQDKLNSVTHRNDFMPYAPVLRVEDAALLFKDFHKFKESCYFMTVALPIDTAMNNTPLFNAIIEAIHRNGTCRIQVVDYNSDALAYKLLTAYDKHVLINTSYNMHEHPISCTLPQCILTEKEMNLGDNLVIGGN